MAAPTSSSAGVPSVPGITLPSSGDWVCVVATFPDNEVLLGYWVAGVYYEAVVKVQAVCDGQLPPAGLLLDHSSNSTRSSPQRR